MQRRGKIILLIGVVIVLLFLFLAIFGEKRTEQSLNSTGDAIGISLLQRDFKVGIGPIPKNFPSNQEGWQDMFDKIPEVGEIVIAQNNWRDSIDTSGEIPEILKVVESQKIKYHYTPQFGINFFDTGNENVLLSTRDNPTNDWTNEESKQKYKEVALKICKNYNAEYLALGIEVNTYYEKNPADFERFVNVYKEMYDQIKTECPNTKVFVTFQLEKMKGLGDKSFGKNIDPEWDLINKFGGKLDLIAFTTYPELEYSSPSKMPKEYYSEITKYTNKKIVFTEIGWTNDNGDYLSKFLKLTSGMNIEFVNWVFMHDLPNSGPLTKVGLRKSNGDPKHAWFKWKALKEVPYKK